MGDFTDDVMTGSLPGILKRVAIGLGLKPELAKYLAVETVAEPAPYRVMSAIWRVEGPAVTGARLERCHPDFEGARELSVTYEVDVGDLRDTPGPILDDIQGFAEKARAIERRTVLMLVAGSARESVFDVDGIEAAVSDLDGTCRLIASGSTAEKAKERGIVDDVVSPHGALPRGVAAMIVRLGNGPTVHRVVDDLSLTWVRKSDSVVELRLSERFFLEGIAHAFKLVRPTSVPK